VKKLTVIGLVLLMCLLVLSCARFSPSEPPITPPTVPEPVTGQPQPAPVEVEGPLPLPLTPYTTISIPIGEFPNQPHIQAVMNATVDEELTVTLGSNPTTGFLWSEEAEISDESIVQQVSHIYIGSGTNVPGASGEEVWVFQGLKKGTTTIYMEYSRPWVEGDIGHWTVTITANIKL